MRLFLGLLAGLFATLFSIAALAMLGIAFFLWVEVITYEGPSGFLEPSRDSIAAFATFFSLACIVLAVVAGLLWHAVRVTRRTFHRMS